MQETPLRDQQPNHTFAWQAHPARERPRAAVLAIAIIAAVAGAVWVSFGPVPAAGSALLLLASLNRFFFPSRFSIDGDGIHARYPLGRMHLRWADVRRFAHDRHGGYLATRARPSRFDAYRGVHLLFGTQREAAIGSIRAHLRADARQTGEAIPAPSASGPSSALSLDGGC